jgi:hypothetical protein
LLSLERRKRLEERERRAGERKFKVWLVVSIFLVSPRLRFCHHLVHKNRKQLATPNFGSPGRLFSPLPPSAEFLLPPDFFVPENSWQSPEFQTDPLPLSFAAQKQRVVSSMHAT